MIVYKDGVMREATPEETEKIEAMMEEQPEQEITDEEALAKILGLMTEEDAMRKIKEVLQNG